MRILRNLIIISVLLVSVTVQASGVDELVRIKQNYARMLVPSGKDPFGLLSILSSIQPEPLRTKILSSLLCAFFSSTTLRRYLRSLS